MASLLERLKERKLFQWAVAFLAGAWVVFEVADAVGGRLGWPDVLYRGLLVLIALGFCIVLVVAWYHGEKGRQRVSGPELLIIALLLFLAGGAVSLLAHRRDTGGESNETGVGAFAASRDEDRPLVAVLPLDNNSPAADDAYFADGVHEELISRLAQISALRVTSRFSMDRYRERAGRPSLAAIGAELGADFLIEGSARIGGGLVRITVQLIDGRTDEHVWSENFDSPYSPEDYIRLQSEIAQRIAARVDAEITPEEEARIGAVPTSSLEAFDHYIRGNVLYDERVEGSADRALDEYRLAVAADSLFAAAYAGIAMCHGRKVDSEWLTGGETEDVLLAEGLEAAERAIRLAPTSPDGWVAKGYIQYLLDPYDPPAMVQASERSVVLDPRSFRAQSHLAAVYFIAGDDSASIAHSLAAQRIDPARRYLTFLRRGRIAYFNGDPERAAALFDSVVATAPAFVDGHISRGLARAAAGDLTGAAAEAEALERMGAPTQARGFVALVAALEGRDAEARSALRAFGHPDREVHWARVLIVLGEEDRALDYLENGKVHFRFLSDPFLDPLRDHPRFRALLERYGGDGGS